MHLLSAFSLPILLAEIVTAQSGANGWAATVSSNSTWPHQSFRTEPDLRPPVFRSNRTGATVPGYIFLNLQGSAGNATSGSVILTQDGELIWGDASNSTTANLTPNNWDRQSPLLRWNGTSVGILEAYGSIEMFNDRYSRTHNVRLIDPSLGTDKFSYADVHEAYLTPQGTLLVTAVNSTGPVDLTAFGGPKDGYVADCLLYEVEVSSNRILYRFSAFEHSDQIPLSDSRALPLTGRNGVGNQTDPWDSYHLNSITQYGDGYIFSLRHTSTAYYLSRSQGLVWQIHGTNNTMQKVQDFTMGNDTTFASQHDIRVSHVEESSLVLHLHDNDNWTPTTCNPSSALFLRVDLHNMSVTNIRRLKDENNAPCSYAGGSVQAFDDAGRYFVNYGAEPFIQEFDRDGRLIWSMQFSSKGQMTSYRAYKADWQGYPQTLPKVMACLSDGSTNVYSSWNGATEVTAWRVFAGNTEGNLQSIAQVVKMGFETSTALKGVYKYVQVESVGGGRWPQTDVRSQTVRVEDSC